MPKVRGVIDCSLIAIHTPPIHHPVYPARWYRTIKGFSGLNELFVLNFEGNFSYVNARYPGSVQVLEFC